MNVPRTTNNTPHSQDFIILTSKQTVVAYTAKETSKAVSQKEGIPRGIPFPRNCSQSTALVIARWRYVTGQAWRIILVMEVLPPTEHDSSYLYWLMEP